MSAAFAIRALQRHIVLILITAVVITGAGLVLGSYLPKTYSSNAQILLGLDTTPDRRAPKLQRAPIDPQTATLYLKERAMTYAQLMTADDVIMPVATAAAVDPEALRGRVEAAVVPETVILDLQVSGSSPEEAVRLAEALSVRFQVQVSALNVRTGGPVIVPAQVSAPRPPAGPDQLHGKTLAAVSSLTGLVVAVLLALLVAVIKRNRAAASRTPSTRSGDASADRNRVAVAKSMTSSMTRNNALLRAMDSTRRRLRVRTPFRTTGLTKKRLRAIYRAKGTGQ
jgi:succinoglycan biosynthesis transport protein ExoP